MKCGLHVRCERSSHTDAGLHRDTYLSLHARRSFVSRASTLPYGSALSHAGADPHALNTLFLHTQVYPPNVSSHTHARSAADRARLCRALFFPFIRRRSAPRKIPAQPDSSFPLRPCAARRKKSACGHFVPCGREYSLPTRPSPAPKPGSSSGAAS